MARTTREESAESLAQMQADQRFAQTNGPAAAAILAAAIGCAALGIIIPLVEISEAIKKLCNYYDPVGPLAGKTTFSVVVWLIAWAVLHAAWKNKNVAFSKTLLVSYVLVFVGFLGSFPPFFTLFSKH